MSASSSLLPRPANSPRCRSAVLRSATPEQFRVNLAGATGCYGRKALGTAMSAIRRKPRPFLRRYSSRGSDAGLVWLAKRFVRCCPFVAGTLI